MGYCVYRELSCVYSKKKTMGYCVYGDMCCVCDTHFGLLCLLGDVLCSINYG